MRFLVLITVLIGALIGLPLHAEQWNWEVALPSYSPPTGDTLVTDLRYTIQLPGETGFHYLRIENSVYSALVLDRDPDAVQTDWEEIPFPWEGIDPVPKYDEVVFRPVGDLMQAAVMIRPPHEGPYIYSGRVYYRDFSQDDAVWVEDSTASLVYDAGQELYDSMTAFGDFDGDGVEDWAIAYGAAAGNIRFFFRDPVDPANTQIVTQQVTEPNEYGYRPNVTQLVTGTFDTQPGTDMYVCFSSYVDGQGGYSYLIPRVVYNISRDTYQSNDTSFPASVLNVYDPELDGQDQVLVMDEDIWKTYRLQDDQFVFDSRVSPPMEVFGFQYARGTQQDSILYAIDTWEVYAPDHWVSNWPRSRVSRWRLAEDGTTWVYDETIRNNCILYSMRLLPWIPDGTTDQAISCDMFWYDPYEWNHVHFMDMMVRREDGWRYLPEYDLDHPYDGVRQAQLDDDLELEQLVYRYSEDWESWWWVEQNWDGEAWVDGRRFDPPDSYVGYPLFAELNGDGRDDILYPGGTASVSRLTDGELSWVAASPFENLDNPPAGHPAFVLDVDGDGRDDLVYSGGYTLLNRTELDSIPSVPTPTLPNRFRLLDAYPNPFNPSTTITLELPQAGHLRVAVYDLLGREVAVLQDRNSMAGRQRVAFDGNELASGVYLVRASLDGGAGQVRKVVLVK